jgi:hypothetical protein
MYVTPRPLPRCFKTKYFAKQARKANIDDKELCRTLKDLSAGKGTDLGGGVFKKRMNENRHRSIIVAKSDKYWVLEFLFGKKDAENITRVALDGFRTLADTYAVLKTGQLAKLLESEALKEICNEPTRNNQITAEHAKA